MHRHAENPLRMALADHVIVENLADLARSRHPIPRFHKMRALLLADDVHAQLDAFIADEDCWPGDELANLVLRLAAERTVQRIL